MYRIVMIEKVRHGERTEVIPCDATVELLALELSAIGISYPVSEDDGGRVLDRFTDLDAEIGQEEGERSPTREYDEQVARAVDEFNLEEDEYIDYAKLNVRLKAVLDRMEAGTFVPMVKKKWRG